MTKNELHDLLIELNVVNVQSGNKDFRALCPFHDETNASWGIAYEEPHMFGCFSCGAKGNIVTLLHRLGNYSKKEAEKIARYRSLGRNFKIYERNITSESLGTTRNRAFLKVFKPAFKSKAATVYMLARLSVTKAFLKDFHLGYDVNQKRVIFPWIHYDQFYGATGRDITHTNELKTLPYFGLVKERMFYLPYQKVEKRMVIVEGEIDALSVARCYNGIAALGNGTLSEARFKWLLEQGCEEVSCMFDNNRRGFALREEMRALGRKLGFKVTTVLYDTSDPGELTFEAVNDAVVTKKGTFFTLTRSVFR